MAVSRVTSAANRELVALSRIDSIDLIVEFSGGYRLRLFCDCFDLEEDGDNYSFHSDRGISVVRAGGMLVAESKRGPIVS